MGRRKGRDISGWLVVDKPAGISSNAVVNKVRWAFNAKKAGHAGTLDPEATGVLAVAMGPVGAVGAAMIAGASALWIVDRLLGARDVISVLSRRLVWYGGFFLLALPGAFVAIAVLTTR